MKKLKKNSLLFFMLMYNLTSYADRPGHRVYDDEPSAFSTILFVIFGLIFAGFLGPALLKISAEDGFKDKETTQMGCWLTIAAIGAIFFLVSMCSH
ncbi:MAG: hypothetical protein U0L54_06775 [Bacteroidales bacterium]|nr:hypothetical protein [Bacteroidales bacterium]